jgi:molybdenum ABC transporter molybdate-binding protein
MNKKPPRAPWHVLHRHNHRTLQMVLLLPQPFSWGRRWRSRMRAALSGSHFPCGEGRGLLDLGKVQKEFAGGKGPLWAERAGARESLGKGSVPLHVFAAYPADWKVARSAGRIQTPWLVFLGSIVLFAALGFALSRTGDRHQHAKPPLLVYCAASLKAPLEAISRDYKKENGVQVQLQFGGSQTLLANIEISKRGDLFLPADESYLATGRDKELIADTIPLARMSGVLAVHKGNPKNIHTVADLLRSDVSPAQANPDTAAIGKLVREPLQKTGQWEPLKAHTKVFKPNVNDVANDLKLGSADAGFIWDAQLAQYPDLESVPISELTNITGHIAAAVLRCSNQREAALQFARYLSDPAHGVKQFELNGFKPPDVR